MMNIDSEPAHVAIQRFRDELSKQPIEEIDFGQEILKLYLLFPIVGVEALLQEIRLGFTGLGEVKTSSKSVLLFERTDSRLQFLKGRTPQALREIIATEELFPY